VVLSRLDRRDRQEVRRVGSVAIHRDVWSCETRGNDGNQSFVDTRTTLQQPFLGPARHAYDLRRALGKCEVEHQPLVGRNLSRIPVRIVEEEDVMDREEKARRTGKDRTVVAQMQKVMLPGEERDAALLEREATHAAFAEAAVAPPQLDVELIARPERGRELLRQAASEGSDAAAGLVSGQKDSHRERGMLPSRRS
jgi:hypothetical protein